ncbi:hypothetical protein NCCP2648_04500 [Lacticaseibacillus rhamnosus]|nr:hypothetical protein NCCP2648_04500 [Lacticaseibacillus rhamnosus]
MRFIGEMINTRTKPAKVINTPFEKMADKSGSLSIENLNTASKTLRETIGVNIVTVVNNKSTTPYCLTVNA